MILIDAGPLVALVNRNDSNHSRRQQTAGALPQGPMFTTWPCFTEAMHLLGRRMGYAGQAGLWNFLIRGKLKIQELSDPIVHRSHELMGKYRDLPMDFADSTLVALAEQNPTAEVFTIDSDFHVYRFRDGRPVPLAKSSIRPLVASEKLFARDPAQSMMRPAVTRGKTMLKITLTGELETTLHQAADSAGKSPEEFACDLLRSALVKKSPPPANGAKNLAEYLGDFIGCVKGPSGNFSENTGQQFTELVVEKHRKRSL